jgi:hypothetical protein
MRAILSARLQAYLRQIGSHTLTVTLHPMRCCGGTIFEVSVGAQEPRHPTRYTSFEQDDMRIYYSPPLGRHAQTLELDYAPLLFRSRPILSGPEELVATVLIGRL